MGYNAPRQITFLVRTKFSPYGAQGHYVQKAIWKIGPIVSLSKVLLRNEWLIYFSLEYFLIR